MRNIEFAVDQDSGKVLLECDRLLNTQEFRSIFEVLYESGDDLDFRKVIIHEACILTEALSKGGYSMCVSYPCVFEHRYFDGQYGGDNELVVLLNARLIKTGIK